MTDIVVDTYAWIEYFNASEKGLKAKQIIENKDHKIFISSASFAEIISKFLRTNKDINIAISGLNTLSTAVVVSQEISILAGQIHFNEKKKNKDFGMLDSFVAATAKKLNAKILTGDNDFKNFKEAIFI
ncbi:PIN domain-containing protein [Candidatus Woesearchaeota archaeon]|nr:PIN domain-containing protein [Candidatus Woesearchaeota archaeon]